MVDFIECLEEVGLLSCLAIIFVYISYLRLELISAVISICCGLPLAIEIFSSSHLRHTILMFNPKNLDEFCVHATNL
jgi:hypothetical protein